MQTSIRRKDREIPLQEAIDLLERGSYGVLATAGEDGWPSATPLSYVYADGAVCFHCAPEGRKLRDIAAGNRVCFTVVGNVQPVKEFSTKYESVMMHGTAELVGAPEEKIRLLRLIADKYCPGEDASGTIERGLAKTAVVKITPVQISGKAIR